jgi:hypothetical protein
MEIKHNEVTVGLFGTCDNIKWRDPFMKAYEEKGIKYFNPMIDDWSERLENSRKGLCPNPTEEENYYLKNAEVILFPVLEGSLGNGSLGELGFSVNTVLRRIMSGENQFLIALIDDQCTDERKSHDQRKESNKNRALVKSKLIKSVSYPSIVLVNTLEEMFNMSFEMYDLAKKAKGYQETLLIKKTA